MQHAQVCAATRKSMIARPRKTTDPVQWNSRAMRAPQRCSRPNRSRDELFDEKNPEEQAVSATGGTAAL